MKKNRVTIGAQEPHNMNDCRLSSNIGLIVASGGIDTSFSLLILVRNRVITDSVCKRICESVISD